jgi:hypothetical protein
LTRPRQAELHGCRGRNGDAAADDRHENERRKDHGNDAEQRR